MTSAAQERAQPIASTELARLLGEHRRQGFTLVRPGGNPGDHLIYLGMRRLMERLGLDHEEVSLDEFLASAYDRERVIYIHGGGGFAPWWSGRATTAFRKAAQTHAGTVIVGPTTFCADAAYLHSVFASVFDAAVARRVYVFARDRVSFEIVRDLVGGRATVGVDHDTALNLGRPDLLAGAGPANGEAARRPYVLHALRQDAERAAIGPPDPFACPVDPVRYCWGFADWLLLHAGASQLITDRLHSAIAGTILGIPTTLLPNRYHKNRAVWEMSLRQRGVQWSDRLPDGMRPRLFAAVGLARLLSRHRRVQRLFGRLYFGRLEAPSPRAWEAV